MSVPPAAKRKQLELAARRLVVSGSAASNVTPSKFRRVRWIEMLLYALIILTKQSAWAKLKARQI